MADWIDSRSPAFIGAGLGMLAGVCLFGYGVFSLVAGDVPAPLSVSLMVAGVLEWALSFFAVRKNRAAWSFVVALNAVGFAIFLFGAPKVRDGFDTNLAVGLLPALAFLVITVLYSLASDEYRGT